MSKKRLKVLQVIDDVGQTPARGVKTFYHEGIALAQKGFEVHILTIIERQSISNWRDYLENERKKYGIHFHPLYIPILVSFHRSYFLFSRIIYFLIVIFLLKKYNFDIVHEYVSAPLLFLKAAIYKRIGNPKVIFTLVTYNTGILGSFKFIQGVKWVDRIICLTHHQANLLIRNGVNRKKVVYLPIGIDVNYFEKKFNQGETREKFKIKEDKLVVLFLGPIQESKGVFILAESARQVIRKSSDVLFLFVCAPRGRRIKYSRNRKKLEKIIQKKPF